jgi:hypothetical protein
MHRVRNLNLEQGLGRSENSGVPVSGHNLSPLVEIELTDLFYGTPGTPRDDTPVEGIKINVDFALTMDIFILDS